MKSRREYQDSVSNFLVSFLMLFLGFFLIYVVIIDGEIVIQSDVITYDEDESLLSRDERRSSSSVFQRHIPNLRLFKEVLSGFLDLDRGGHTYTE